MEFLGQQRLSETCNLLGVPGYSSLDVDSDEGEVVIGIRPKSSPLPRRRSSSADEESEAEPPPSGSRRVSFADAKGLRLVQVKEFDTWDVPKLPGYGSSEGEGKEAEEYFLSPHTFALPLSTEELFLKVRDQKLELETIEVLPKTTILKGVIRVLNISFSKAVYVRTTLDTWASYFDLLAEYVPGSNDGLMDCFSFKLTLVPPFGEQGARVEFCLRYETPVGTFWANNNNRNYVLFCQHRVKDTQQRDNGNKKSCLKTISQNFSAENVSTMDASPEESPPAISGVSKCEEEVTAMKAKQISKEEDGHKAKTENRRFSSMRRSNRKAARAARARERFAQRGTGGSDADTPESLETPSKSLLDVLHDASLGNDSSSDREPEKPESKETQEQRTSRESTDSTAVNSVASPGPSEGLVGPNTSFTFGPVMAPLYQHMFGRAGSESENIDERGNPIQATLSIRESTSDYPHTEENGCALINTRESNPERSDATLNHPPDEEEQTCLCETAGDIQDCAANPQNPDELIHLDQECTDTPDAPQIRAQDPTQSFPQQGEEQEDSLSCDLQNQKPPENASPRTNKDNDITNGQHTTASTTEESLELETLVEPFCDLTPYPVHHSAPLETENVSMSNDGDAAGNSSSTPRSCQETQTETRKEQYKSTNHRYEDETEHAGESEVNDAEDESMTKAIVSDSDAFVEWKEEESFKDEPMSAALLREDFSFADTAEEKNWEMMVEEDERNILADPEADGETDLRGRSEAESENSNSAEREKFLAEDLGGAGENMTEDEDAEDLKDKGKDGDEICKAEGFEYVQVQNTEITEAEEEDRDVDIDVEMGGRQEETEVEKDKYFAEMQEAIIGRIDIQEEEEIEGEEETEIHWNSGDDDEIVEEKNPNYEMEVAVDGDLKVVDPDSESMTAEDGGDEAPRFEETLDVTQFEEEGLSAQMHHEQAKGEADRDRDEGGVHIPAEICLYSEEECQGGEVGTNKGSQAEGDSESDQTGQDSAESDSDDEVELYMHCLRAVHAGAQNNKDAGFSVGKRPSVSRGKLLSTPMPSITESLDEEPHLGCHQDFHDDTDVAGVQPVAAALSPLRGQESLNAIVSWWKETFSCSNISRTLLCITLMVFFFVVAYHYDFLACFGLYLISVVWLCCQGEKQPVKNNNRIG